jgi:sugar O-acyltransferase (sialic acid O-acetyltransferase NeuD family)
MRTLYLCGAGNSEGVRLALAVSRARARWDRILLLDDDPHKTGESRLDVEIAGPFELLGNADPATDQTANLVARTTARRAASRARIAARGIPFAGLLSPEIDTLGVDLADDVMAFQHAILGPEVRIDEGTVVFMGGIVGHECRVGRCCVIAANAVLNARVVLEDEVYIGTNATVLPEVTIGRGATVAAGSVVMQDVPAGATAIGVPAEIVTPAHAPAPGVPRRPARAAAGHEHGNGAVPVELERDIALVWGEILQLAEVSVEKNFFDLGGDSLLALRVCERLRQRLGGHPCIMDIFHYPTVRDLARHLHNGADGDHQRGDPDAPVQDRASIRRELMQRRRVGPA